MRRCIAHQEQIVRGVLVMGGHIQGHDALQESFRGLQRRGDESAQPELMGTTTCHLEDMRRSLSSATGTPELRENSFKQPECARDKKAHLVIRE